MVVVVSGVGEWLDVADAVILMRNFKAQTDSRRQGESVTNSRTDTSSTPDMASYTACRESLRRVAG